MPTMTRELFSKFQELVYDKSDLYFPPGKQVFFERQLRERFLHEGLPDYESYYERLKEDPEWLGRLVQGLTTNQTYFFRNPAHFRALGESVFPELIDAKNREVIRSWGGPGAAAIPGRRHPAMRIRVWSSGCSTGEEAYSIAFTLLDALNYPKAWDVEILGTDIKREALMAAQAGVYERDAAKWMDASLAGKYMEVRGRRLAVREKPREIVRFREANLKQLSGDGGSRALTLKPLDGPEMTLEARGYFDVIFCRNVMIYFDREGQQRLVNALFDCLRPGGYLFTGDSEPLHLFSHGFEMSGSDGALYYQKPL